MAKFGSKRINENGVTEICTPMRVNKETIDVNEMRGDIVPAKIGSRYYPCLPVWMEEVMYKEYMRLEWADVKAEDRRQRCRIPDGKGGTIMCPETNKCRECKRYHDFNYNKGADTSFEGLQEEGFDLSARRNEAEEIAWDIDKKAILDYLEEKDPLGAEIIRRIYQGDAPGKIEEDLGLSKGKRQSRLKKAQKLAKEYYNR